MKINVLPNLLNVLQTSYYFYLPETRKHPSSKEAEFEPRCVHCSAKNMTVSGGCHSLNNSAKINAI